jgi:hypothetical protein
MEQRLMQQCVELQRAGVQPTMPLLGSFCIEKLKLQMKVMLFLCAGLAEHDVLHCEVSCGRHWLPAAGCRRFVC